MLTVFDFDIALLAERPNAGLIIFNNDHSAPMGALYLSTGNIE
jgi:hypothetical protein